jgi:hypothetical protein
VDRIVPRANGYAETRETAMAWAMSWRGGRTFRESAMLIFGHPVLKGRTHRQQRQTQLTESGTRALCEDPGQTI